MRASGQPLVLTGQEVQEAPEKSWYSDEEKTPTSVTNWSVDTQPIA
jgi:hypothetical protein